MKFNPFRTAFFLSIFMLFSVVASAQLKIYPIGRAHFGNDITVTFDPTNLVTVALFGRGTDTYRAGSKLSFGDFGQPSSGSANTFIAEKGTTDSDILQLHGKNGVHFTTGGAGDFEVGRFEPSGVFHARGAVMANSSIYSDQNLKYNVRSLTGKAAIESLRKLRGVQFDWKTDRDQAELSKLATIKPETQKDQDALDNLKAGIQKQMDESKDQLGFIAQEVQTVFPNLVSSDEDGTLSVSYIELIPVLVEAVKEQQKQIEKLRKDLDAMKGTTKSK